MEPDCPGGFTRRQVVELMGDRLNMFERYMNGQTVGICDGRRYNHDTREYEQTECANTPHGTVYYTHDVERFLRGLPVID